MRGKERLPRGCCALWRITPACAGKSVLGCLPVLPFQDHPRVCGEKAARYNFLTVFSGSPPRVRGKDSKHPPVADYIRITPACAGKSPGAIKGNCRKEDHPRVCGEKISLPNRPRAILGSPPRVRGKAKNNLIKSPVQRITPACAGKRLKKAHKIKDFDPVPIRFHLVFRRFERWCSNLPTPDGNVPV